MTEFSLLTYSLRGRGIANVVAQGSGTARSFGAETAAKARIEAAMPSIDHERLLPILPPTGGDSVPRHCLHSIGRTGPGTQRNFGYRSPPGSPVRVPQVQVRPISNTARNKPDQTKLSARLEDRPPVPH
jgi:hypothetical protein